MKLAIQIESRHVHAAAIRPGTFGGSVAWSAVRPLPESVASGDAAAIGRFVASLLREGGIAAKEAVFALSRTLVSTKRLELPSRDAAELPEMVRLAMQRELPIDAAATVIDFSVLGSGPKGSEVFAVAAPEPVVRFLREVAAAANLEVEAITLRCLGTAHLVGRLDIAAVRGMEGQDPLEPAAAGEAAVGATPSILAVDIAGDALELVVVGDGRMRFARGVQLPEAESRLLKAEAATLETRRSWLSYRISQGDEPVAAAVVLGGADVARLAVPQLAAATGLPVRLLRQHPDIRGGDPEVAAPVWPLLGVLLGRRQSRGAIDLAHPKRPPDLASRRRTRMLAAAGLVVIAALGGWTIGRNGLRERESAADELETRARAALTDFLRLKRDRLKLAHLEAWTDGSPAWLDHALAVGSMLPEPGIAVVDRLQGALEIGPVRFERDGSFVADRQVRLVLDGEALDRAAADSLRDRIVGDSRYQVRSTGADAAGGKRLPISFTFQLRSASPAPEEASEESAAKAEAKPRETSDARTGRRRAPGMTPPRRIAGGGEW
jgi:hypothetical protein